MPYQTGLIHRFSVHKMLLQDVLQLSMCSEVELYSGNPHCHVLQELDLFITDESTFKFSAMNPNTKRSKKFRKEFKKDPEKLEVYLKKDI